MTHDAYAKTADAFALNVTALAPMESIERFAKLLPSQGAKILDIGCGSGRDAKIFTEKGISVLGIDFCMELINIAKLNAPLAHFQRLDIEKMDFPSATFDGAWAGCSLLHLPKSKLPAVLSKIHSYLKDNGYFYLTLKQGSGEVLEKDTRYEEHVEKFWAFYEENELLTILQSLRFKILESCIIPRKSDYHSHPCIRIFCQK